MQTSLPSVAAVYLSMTACISVRSAAWRLGRVSNTKIPAGIYLFFFSLVILVEYHPYDSLYAGHVTPLPYPSPLLSPPPFSTRNFSLRLNPLALFISYRLLLPPSTSIFPTFTYTRHNKQHHHPFQILLLTPISKENLPRGVFQRGSLQGTS